MGSCTVRGKAENQHYTGVYFGPARKRLTKKPLGRSEVKNPLLFRCYAGFIPLLIRCYFRRFCGFPAKFDDFRLVSAKFPVFFPVSRNRSKFPALSQQAGGDYRRSKSTG